MDILFHENGGKSKKYLDQSLKIAKEISNIEYLGNLHNVYGSLYTDLEILDSAIMHFDSSIYYHETTQNILSLSASKFNKAIALEKSGHKRKHLNCINTVIK